MRKITRLKIYLRNKIPALDGLQRYLYKFKPYQAKFRAYYLDSGWKNTESASGPGSTLKATANMRERLPGLFHRYGIKVVADIPCGDFNWMKEVDLSGVEYHGFDIVKDLIDDNIAKHRKRNVHFACLDIVRQVPPRSDLLMCRDLLIHYSEKHIRSILCNMLKSGAGYILTTTYTGVDVNREIEDTGLFRPINLQLPPFDFPTPILLIEDGGGKLGKSLGLWKAQDLVGLLG